MIRACAVAALVLASCASSALVTSSSSPSPPASTAEILKCSSDRLVFLVEQFFARYNARDLDGFLGLFNWTSPAGGGGFSSYFDDPVSLNSYWIARHSPLTYAGGGLSTTASR